MYNAIKTKYAEALGSKCCKCAAAKVHFGTNHKYASLRLDRNYLQMTIESLFKVYAVVQ